MSEIPSSQPPRGANPSDSMDSKPVAAPVRHMPPNMPIVPAGRYRECGECSAMILSDFAKSFDKSARRWELIVYPSLFAFIILAMYGFFLIYSLTQDIRTMASSIDPKMGEHGKPVQQHRSALQ